MPERYQYTETHAHRGAGLVYSFEWACVDQTTVLGELPSAISDIPVFIVHVEGREESHGYLYHTEAYTSVTWKEDGTLVINDATDEEIEACK